VTRHRSHCPDWPPFQVSPDITLVHPRNFSYNSLFCKNLLVTPLDRRFCAVPGQLVLCFEDFAHSGGEGGYPSWKREFLNREPRNLKFQTSAASLYAC
jgi:hypothetical protein